MRLIGYIRVSRVGGREGASFISPQQQRDRIEAHVAGNGHTIVGWQEDLDRTGSSMDRPGLENAIAAIECGDADGLAVAKLDRFARSVSGAAKTLQRIEDAGGVLVAIDLGMDTSTPAGKLMRNVVMALAEFELDRIRESWSDAKTRAVKRGVHISRVPPFGYVKGDDGRLVPHPEHGPLVADAFRMRADDGQPWSAIAKFLDEHAPRGTGNWPLPTVATMIARRTYLGEGFHGDNVNPDAHEPLVDRDLWERAQVSQPKPLIFRGGALLAGIARCAGCGYVLSRRSGGRRGETYYRCRGRHGPGTCTDRAYISERLIDTYVEDAFLRRVNVRVEDSDLTVDSERAVERLEQAESELAAYRDANLISVIGVAAYRQGLEGRARTVDDARNRLADVRRTRGGLRGLVDIADEWPDLTVPERREILAAAIDAVFVKRHLRDLPIEKRVWIAFAGEGPDGLPGRRLSQLRPIRFPND